MGYAAGRTAFGSHVVLHDRTQFECQFTYEISPSHLSARKDLERCRIEAYYFFPTNMAVSALNFPKETFYRQIRTFLRFKSPDLTPEALLDPLAADSPLNALSYHLKHRALDGTAASEATLRDEARLYGCIVSSLFKNQRREAEELLVQARRRPTDMGRWHALESAVQAFLASGGRLLSRYREVLAEADGLPGPLLGQLRQVDEYLTYRFDHTLSALHLALAASWGAPEKLTALGVRMQETASAERTYRIRAGYIVLSPNDPAGLALYTYRSGALKKLVERVLYLDVRTIQENNRWRNLAAMLGAMLAAIVAGWSNQSVVLQLTHVNLWLAVAAFALFYVLKDRIKEGLREYVWEHVSRFFPDNRLMIHDPIKDLPIGRCTERAHYLAKEDLPADVRAVRELHHVVDLDSEREETVLLYRNHVKLNAREILAEHRRRTHVKHFLRFSVDELLPRLDDPHVRVRFYDPETGGFQLTNAPKVYHLNIVFKLQRFDASDEPLAPFYQRIRVVLDKDGIQRIEPVAVANDAPLPAVRRGTGKLEMSAESPASV